MDVPGPVVIIAPCNEVYILMLFLRCGDTKYLQLVRSCYIFSLTYAYSIVSYQTILSNSWCIECMFVYPADSCKMCTWITRECRYIIRLNCNCFLRLWMYWNKVYIMIFFSELWWHEMTTIRAVMIHLLFNLRLFYRVSSKFIRQWMIHWIYMCGSHRFL